jgi:hypothetical protein
MKFNPLFVSQSSAIQYSVVSACGVVILFLLGILYQVNYEHLVEGPAATKDPKASGNIILHERELASLVDSSTCLHLPSSSLRYLYSNDTDYAPQQEEYGRATSTAGQDLIY